MRIAVAVIRRNGEIKSTCEQREWEKSRGLQDFRSVREEDVSETVGVDVDSSFLAISSSHVVELHMMHHVTSSIGEGTSVRCRQEGATQCVEGRLGARLVRSIARVCSCSSPPFVLISAGAKGGAGRP
jgi:hypothetical protein